MDANYTKRSGKGRASLVAGSACEFDLPGSLPYTALSILISCNPVATSETNQTAESSLFLIRKAQGNHLTLVSQWAPSCLHRKKYPGYDSCLHTLILTYDGLCLKFLLKYFNYTSVWFKNVLEDFSLYSQRIKYPSSEACKTQTPVDYPSPLEPIADPNPFNTIGVWAQSPNWKREGFGDTERQLTLEHLQTYRQRRGTVGSTCRGQLFPSSGVGAGTLLPQSSRSTLYLFSPGFSQSLQPRSK